MINQLKKALDLVRRTGDKLMVADSSGDEAYMVMDLDSYERILDQKAEARPLTEEQLIDKINRDVALWKAEQEAAEQKVPAADEPAAPDVSEAPRKNNWSIPDEVKQAAEEVVEEEKKYEVITF